MAIYTGDGTRVTSFNDFCDLYPSYCSGGGSIPTGVKINTSPDGTAQISAGQTTLDKLLATLLSGMAIVKNQAYVPTTQQPNQQPIILPQNLGGGITSGTGATFGDSIENFVTQNTGLLLIGGIAYLLFKSGRK